METESAGICVVQHHSRGNKRVWFLTATPGTRTPLCGTKTLITSQLRWKVITLFSVATRSVGLKRKSDTRNEIQLDQRRGNVFSTSLFVTQKRVRTAQRGPVPGRARVSGEDHHAAALPSGAGRDSARKGSSLLSGTRHPPGS